MQFFLCERPENSSSMSCRLIKIAFKLALYVMLQASFAAIKVLRQRSKRFSKKISISLKFEPDTI